MTTYCTKKDYPKNPDLCEKCKYRRDINTDSINWYCDYLGKTGHRRPKDSTDTWEHCSCFEQEKQ